MDLFRIFPFSLMLWLLAASVEALKCVRRIQFVPIETKKVEMTIYSNNAFLIFFLLQI